MTENTLFDAMNTRDTLTDNGMVAHSTTKNANLDLFFSIGASRGKDITPLFVRAFVENPSYALRILLWARDVREGAGERQIFRDLLQSAVLEANKDAARALMFKIPMLGRWDDMLIFEDTELWDDAVGLIRRALRNEDGLCAKWMPRKGLTAVKLRKAMGLSPKAYRKLLVGLTKVVETPMCAKEWDSIDFGKVPSLASARYQKAFGRNAPEKYAAYIEALESGDAKINAGAVYPYNIIQSLRYGEVRVANKQWEALPDYMADAGDERVLPMVDVSGSMTFPAGGNVNITCMDVAVSLGLYVSERAPGVFKDTFLTFSERPQMVRLKGTLKQRMESMESSDWGMNTNLEKAFTTMLTSAQRAKVSADQMPTKLLVMSDMQFDRCVDGGDNTALDMIDQKYEAAGYKRPDIIFWNISAHTGTNPVQKGDRGTALVSGFSPSIMKSVLGVKDIDPMAIMLKTIMSERYDFEGDTYEIEMA